MEPQVGEYSSERYESAEDAEHFAAIERCKGHFFWRRVLSLEEERSPYRTLAKLEQEYHKLFDAKLSGHAAANIGERLEEVARTLETLCPDFVRQNEQAVQLREKEEAMYRDMIEISNTIEEIVRKVARYDRQHSEGPSSSGAQQE